MTAGAFNYDHNFRENTMAYFEEFLFDDLDFVQIPLVGCFGFSLLFTEKLFTGC
jgi:hypothetical protein